jgi:hypothetical protein
LGKRSLKFSVDNKVFYDRPENELGRKANLEKAKKYFEQAKQRMQFLGNRLNIIVHFIRLNTVFQVSE